MTSRLDRLSPLLGAVLTFIVAAPMYLVVTAALFGRAGHPGTAVFTGGIIAAYQYFRIVRERRRLGLPEASGSAKIEGS